MKSKRLINAMRDSVALDGEALKSISDVLANYTSKSIFQNINEKKLIY